MPDSLVVSLRAAVEASPEDVPLRMHFAELLASQGLRVEAVREAAVVLQRDPENAAALRLIGGVEVSAGESGPRGLEGEAETLRRLEAELAGVVPPMFVSSESGADGASVGEAYDAEAAGGLRLADVGGMGEVK